jgi:hypothetical protein
MSSISTLLIRNLRDVFGENDPARRRAAIDEIWTEDGVFYDPKSGVHRPGRPDCRRLSLLRQATLSWHGTDINKRQRERCVFEQQSTDRR